LTYSEGYLDKTEQLDGKLVTPPTEAGSLTFADVAAPAGNVMGVYTD
jgi:hypothetical protein